jgi:hypothetical protein
VGSFLKRPVEVLRDRKFFQASREGIRDTVKWSRDFRALYGAALVILAIFTFTDNPYQAENKMFTGGNYSQPGGVYAM